MARFLKVAPIIVVLAVGMRAGRIDFGPDQAEAFSMAPGASACTVPLAAQYGLPPAALTQADGMDDPEPPIAVLVGIGLVGLGLVARKRSWRSR